MEHTCANMEGECSSWVLPSCFVVPVAGYVMGETVKVPVKNFLCSFEDCDATFNKSWKLQAHMCKHTGEKPFVCEHEGCGKGFSRNFHLARHQLMHSGDKPFQCEHDGCKDTFTTKANLKKHVLRKHENKNKLYVCVHSGCGKSFKKNNQLKIHEYEHTNLLPFKCNFEGCEKRFPVPSKLKRHEKVHEGYPCKEEGCSFVGKTWTEYLKHQSDHQDVILCDQCNKKFKNAWFLKQHQKVHLPERVVFKCPREGCDRTYTTSFNLQNHILAFHEERRPFKCERPDCQKSFAMKQSLDRHAVAHDPQKQKLKKRPRPKRSLASRLSGYKPSKRGQPESNSNTMTKMLEKTNLSEQNF
ncbi:transcription factor IIIA-like [Acipenser ruthenus]|uniref:transcription factor IIIA-like n=1 Tax=Acipenser ruthenus TaxID=7906 RepID=UPI0027419F76|nr:transcription factor IIIA-like [Acipenser ruthenus]